MCHRPPTATRTLRSTFHCRAPALSALWPATPGFGVSVRSHRPGCTGATCGWSGGTTMSASPCHTRGLARTAHGRTPIRIDAHRLGTGALQGRHTHLGCRDRSVERQQRRRPLRTDLPTWAHPWPWNSRPCAQGQLALESLGVPEGSPLDRAGGPPRCTSTRSSAPTVSTSWRHIPAAPVTRSPTAPPSRCRRRRRPCSTPNSTKSCRSSRPSASPPLLPDDQRPRSAPVAPAICVHTRTSLAQWPNPAGHWAAVPKSGPSAHLGSVSPPPAVAGCLPPGRDE